MTTACNLQALGSVSINLWCRPRYCDWETWTAIVGQWRWALSVSSLQQALVAAYLSSHQTETSAALKTSHVLSPWNTPRWADGGGPPTSSRPTQLPLTWLVNCHKLSTATHCWTKGSTVSYSESWNSRRARNVILEIENFFESRASRVSLTSLTDRLPLDSCIH